MNKQDRVIKFRCWDKARNEMYSPHTFHINPHSKSFMSIRYNGDYAVDSILMQFTGLFDKEGKEIYEGDIIRDDEATYKVYWVNDAGAWDLLRLEDGNNMIGFGCYMRSIISDIIGDSILVGNIHQNPEFLTK